jgi:dTDP-4-amino-4,6-dideoxygalactose transaminase
MTDGAMRVPRSRAFQTHQTMREDILSAIEPLLFGSMRHAYEVRAQFERDFAAVVAQPHAIAVHSGTIGLFLALRACGVSLGDEVITVSNSDISTTAAIRQCGATPVMCDVLESDYTIDVSLIEPLITSKTRAILPVDLHGHPADVRAVRAIADRYGLMVIEDAALALGAVDHGVPVGAFAHATVFSFAPFKPLGSAGNGAMVVTSHDGIARRLRLLVGYGYDPDTDGVPAGHQRYIDEGYNVPLDGLEAALLSVKLPHLTAWTEARRRIAQAYHDGLRDTSARCPRFRPESQPTFRSYTIQVPRRDEIHAHLRRVGVEVVLHYTPPIYQHPVYGGQLPNSHALPVTDRLAEGLICLPVAPELTDEDTAYVLAELRAHLDL